MKTSFLKYYKTILTKVSFDKMLFEKEYQKALKLLQRKERSELKDWVVESKLLAKVGVIEANTE